MHAYAHTGGSSFGENLRHNPTSPSTPPPPAISNSSSAAVLADMHRRDKEAETGERPNGERLKEDIVVQKWLREKERLGLEPERAQLAVEAAVDTLTICASPWAWAKMLSFPLANIFTFASQSSQSCCFDPNGVILYMRRKLRFLQQLLRAVGENESPIVQHYYRKSLSAPKC